MNHHHLVIDESRNYADELWSKDQQRALEAIANAIISPLTPKEKESFLNTLPSDLSAEDKARANEYADLSFSDLPNGVNLIAMHVHETVSFMLRSLISLLLKSLATRAGCLALIGRVGPVWDVDQDAIVTTLLAWKTSPIQVLRLGQFGLIGLTMMVFYRHFEKATEAIGYPTGPTDDWKTPPGFEEQTAIPHFNFQFLNDNLPLSPTSEPIDLETDVVVVGSGCGGGVVAAYLAERGLKVIVVDKGLYVRPEEMPLTQSFGFDQMFERLGFVPSSTMSIGVLAGSGFGGGSTINWGATLTPRYFLRQAWSKKYGMPYFESALFTQDLDACAHRMGTTDNITHNRANTLLMLGARRAGQPVSAVPQNNGNLPHYCGKCTFGCPSGHKHGTLMTYLRDAAEHGAQFLTHCDVERVLMEGGKATGVMGHVKDQSVRIHGKQGVVISAGSVNTPAILLRTPELKKNKQIGEHLHLHPVAFVHGFYDIPVYPWEGGSLTTVSNAAELVDPHGWGAKIEVMASAPSLFCAILPFQNSAQHKKLASRYRYSYTAIVLVRDRDGGRVKLDKYGRALMDYNLSKFDQKSMLEGVKRATEIHMNAGASAIAVTQFDVPLYECPKNKLPSSVPEKLLPGSYPFGSLPPQGDVMHPSFVEFQKQIERAGFSTLRCTLGSAHQMGSCRMGADPTTSACDPRGRLRGASRLWVADGSVLPEASGVNPMLTILGTSRGIARNIAEELGVARPDDLASTASTSIPAPSPPRAHL